MSLGTILIIILIIFLLGGFSGRFGGYGYGFGHGGIGVIGIILIMLVVLLLMGRIGSERGNAEHRTSKPGSIRGLRAPGTTAAVFGGTSRDISVERVLTGSVPTAGLS